LRPRDALSDLQANAGFIEITPAGAQENHPHEIKRL
jgi:hypothetical protein